MTKILIIDAPYYAHISKELRAGAEAVLKQAGVEWDYKTVPGVLEIPAALSMVIQEGLDPFEEPQFAALDRGQETPPLYDAFVVLGCVIRGETTHYEIVAYESARALMRMAVDLALPIGNGILTVENEAQALARAKASEMDKGGHAARAAIEMLKFRDNLGE